MNDMSNSATSLTGTSRLFERPRYFPRQLITPDDMNLAQDYVRNRMRRHNRLLHGWGVVCGAIVQPGKDPWTVVISPGFVLGPYGDEISIDQPVLTVVTPTTPLISGYVYARGGDLWLTAADGSRTRQLTFLHDKDQAEAPAWSPDGTTIVYSRRHTPDDGQRESELWTIHPDGSGDQLLLAPQQNEDLFDPTWSPDGKRVLFTANPYTSDSESWSIDQLDLATGQRSTLVPTAMMRPPASRTRLRRRAVAVSMQPHSACIAWWAVSCALTGRNVPAPTCRVSVSRPIPATSSASASSGVKCRAAVGAATAPSFCANIVW